MSKIIMTDSIQNIIVKMSEGNPGATVALMELYTKSDKIDPDAAIGSFAALLSLDSFEIYGTDIYVLWNDICNRNTVDTVAVIRATQLGLLDQSILKRACGQQDRSGCDMIPVKELYLKVIERLPEFNGGDIDRE